MVLVHVLKNLEDGQISSAIALIWQRTGLPVNIYFGGGIINDPVTFDPYSEGDPGDKGIWVYSEGKIQNIVKPSRFLYVLKAVNEINQFCEALKRIEELAWIWIVYT